MTAPLEAYGHLGEGAGLVGAFLIGVAFGFFLERGGLGNARKLAGQFYLTDLTVFKVMFTAIVTAMLGLFWLARIGLLDPSRIFFNPTYVLPQLVGGLIFGAGFVTAGLCPGTACVAAATGKLDGVSALLGIFCGIFAFGETHHLITDFLYSGAMGQVSIPRVLGLPHGITMFAVVLLALGGFVGAEAIERRRGRA